MSGFLSHLAARGMGQAGSVHAAARLPYASPPALVETAGEAMAPPPSLQNVPLGGPPQELAQGQALARPDAAPEGEASAAATPPAALPQRPSVPVPKDTASQNHRHARMGPLEIAAVRPHRRPEESAIAAAPDPMVPAAAQAAGEGPSADHRGSEVMRPVRRCCPHNRNSTVPLCSKAL